MTTNELLNQWTKTARVTDQPIIDELYRRCQAARCVKFVDPESFFVFMFYTDDSGVIRMITDPNVAIFDDLDEHIETSPQPTDGLAFQPSEDLDAATLAT